jgi:hypothetical protein
VHLVSEGSYSAHPGRQVENRPDLPRRIACPRGSASVERGNSRCTPGVARRQTAFAADRPPPGCCPRTAPQKLQSAAHFSILRAPFPGAVTVAVQRTPGAVLLAAPRSASRRAASIRKEVP